MAKMIGFHHGALADSYEVRANQQGYTLGESADQLQALGDAAVLLWMEDCLTDSQYNKVLGRIQKKLVKSARVMRRSDNANRKNC